MLTERKPAYFLKFSSQKQNILTWPITAKTKVSPPRRAVAPKVTGLAYFKTFPIKSRALQGLNIQVLNDKN
jgi:hypothetical protein